jgi:hypothetical protein
MRFTYDSDESSTTRGNSVSYMTAVTIMDSGARVDIVTGRAARSREVNSHCKGNKQPGTSSGEYLADINVIKRQGNKSAEVQTIEAMWLFLQSNQEGTTRVAVCVRENPNPKHHISQKKIHGGYIPEYVIS